MYLIARPQPQAKILEELLKTFGIAAQYLPIMELIPNPVNIKLLSDNLATVTAILPISPSSINLLTLAWQRLSPSAQVFCIGASSAQLLATLIDNPIHYPQSKSGIISLIQQQLLLSGKIELLYVVGGDEINPQLANYLQEHQINYEFISLYQRQNCALANLGACEELVLQSNVVGIIITSRLIAEYLVKCANVSTMLSTRINELRLISLHSQISDYLYQQGFNNIYQTKNSSNLAIAELLQIINGKQND